MQSDPFLDFHQTAERAGYPAMLIVSTVSLALVVAPVMLLALTRAVWMLVIAVCSIFVALALLAGGFGAAVADSGEPPPRPAAAASEPAESVATVRTSEPPECSAGHDRRAAPSALASGVT